ncbi:zinc-dependent alcohol dehydrogenase [Kineococcus sp. SYSU DK004]|uniref:zinc-dependent alcohol dehydrogenase n=1 Tax=Kineococcus sp. SYSU DK004 TaxID=3383125 RepID=UPI003D7DD2DD
MRAAVWEAPDVVRPARVREPEVPDGWALLDVACSGVCGTDLSILHGSHPRARPPLVVGHEVSGRVARAGASGPREGALVAVEPLISCGTCRACRTGHPHVCRSLGLFGIDAPGGLAERVAVPPDRLHELPAHVDPRTAALVEPLAVAVHAVRLSGMERGDVVAVHGAGPIGLLTALVARAEGAGTVVVAEPGPWRREVAAAHGFRAVADGGELADALDELTDGEGADTTFDTAGHPSVAALLSAATRVLGRVVVVGVYKQPTALDLQGVCFREQSLQGVRVYTSADVRRAAQLVADDVLGLASFPTTTYPLERAAEAFAAAAAGSDCLKVLVTPRADLVDGTAS